MVKTPQGVGSLDDATYFTDTKGVPSKNEAVILAAITPFTYPVMGALSEY